MQNARLDEAQAGFKIARRNINNLRYADDTTLMEEVKEKLPVPGAPQRDARATPAALMGDLAPARGNPASRALRGNPGGPLRD